MADMIALQRFLGLAPPAIGRIANDHTLLWQSMTDNSRYTLDSDVVFICVDLEAFEFAQHKITEVGIAIADTRDLASLPPGINSDDWLSQIKSTHIRIAEYKHLVNKRFVHGCPDKFNFGRSDVVSLVDVGAVLEGLFTNTGPSITGNGLSQTAAKRNVVLVGHDVGRDIGYLAKLNFTPSNHATIIKTLDTQRLSGSTKRSPVGLGKLLQALNIEASNLHNAGNDATYTLQALLKIAVMHTEAPETLPKKLAEFQTVKLTLTEAEIAVRERKRLAKEKAKLAWQAKKAETERSSQNSMDMNMNMNTASGLSAAKLVDTASGLPARPPAQSQPSSSYNAMKRYHKEKQAALPP